MHTTFRLRIIFSDDLTACFYSTVRDGRVLKRIHTHAINHALAAPFDPADIKIEGRTKAGLQRRRRVNSDEFRTLTKLQSNTAVFLEEKTHLLAISLHPFNSHLSPPSQFTDTPIRAQPELSSPKFRRSQRPGSFHGIPAGVHSFCKSSSFF